jgi:hypothetical protein
MSAVGIHIDLGLRLLDDQLLDAEEHRCGRVDDVQLKGKPGSRTDISALLVGPSLTSSAVSHQITCTSSPGAK